VKPTRFARSQRMTIVNGLLVLVVFVVVLQLWLLVATMNGHLGGDRSVPLPAALASIALLAVNVSLLRYLYRFD
jgi:hypothetical protein